MSQSKFLRIQTLGDFQVWRPDGSKVTRTHWQRDKARSLFQYLITQGHDCTHRERITANLWPQLDEVRAIRDFKVALNALMTALEPNRQSRAPSQFIHRANDAYGVVYDCVVIDATEFRTLAEKAARLERADMDQSISHYQAALDLYLGDYLPDALYDDWAATTREHLLSIFLSSAGRLAHLLLSRNSVQEAIILAQRILARDACWEEAYRILMLGHEKRGNRPLAIKIYHRCQHLLKTELGLEPMPETKDLYQRIRDGRH